MKNVPNWQLLLLIYVLLVGVPVFLLHSYIKSKLLQTRTLAGLLIYFIAIILTAVIMHSVVMWLYYRFLFK